MITGTFYGNSSTESVFYGFKYNKELKNMMNSISQ